MKKQIKKKDDIDPAGARKYIEDFNKKYIELREKEGFSGIEYQMSLIDETMRKDFEKASSIKHSGDKGTARENILRKFFTESGYLPDKFGVSKGSSHVISSTGHISNQIDLLIYDKLNTPKLMSIGEIQYFPIECVYGVIEVKSNIDSKDTLYDALNKIKTFKSLKKSPAAEKNFGVMSFKFPSSLGFGIVFAYEATLSRETMFEYIKTFQNENPSNVWPNLIVILNQGSIGQLKEIKNQFRPVYSTEEINEIKEVRLYGFPTKQNNLLDFYLILMDLMANMNLSAPPLRNYTTLKIAANKYSYSFTYGALVEVETCKKHGEYLRRITDLNLEKILSYGSTVQPINLLEAIDEAYGNGGKNKDNYEKQKRLVKIYNPENLNLKDILIVPEDSSTIIQGNKIRGLAFDDITIENESYLMPYYYSMKENIISRCPECAKKKKKTDK